MEMLLVALTLGGLLALFVLGLGYLFSELGASIVAYRAKKATKEVE